MSSHLAQDPAQDPAHEPARELAHEPWEALSDGQLPDAAQALLAIAQRGSPDQQASVVRAVDELLAEARRRGDPMLVARLLRYAGLVRLVSHAPAEVVRPWVDALIAHARRYGLTGLEVSGLAVHVKLASNTNRDDEAVAAAADALALLDEDVQPPEGMDPQAFKSTLVAGLIDLGLSLTELSTHELADETFQLGEHYARTSSAGAHCVTVLMLNRIRLMLSWGLRLERAGFAVEAAGRFTAAAALAVATEPIWPQSVFPAADQPAAEQLPMATAHALAAPDVGHVDRLRRLLATANFVGDRIMLAIALARSLRPAGRIAEACGVLAEVHQSIAGNTEEPRLRIALVRELALLRAGPWASEPATEYATALEADMWGLRLARIAAIRARAEIQRLARAHGAAAEQARQDPLTGLANRRALDDGLRAVLVDPVRTPATVALLDLDGFKVVNDERSHAEGDRVLREVAIALRDSLRAADLVSRYGGDEFVVLMPGTDVPQALAALRRAVRAVAELPEHLGRGVTMSAGVVAVLCGDTTASVLARADAAMYRAKRDGGNRVAAGVDWPLDQTNRS